MSTLPLPHYLGLNFGLVYVPLGTKRPLEKGWQDHPIRSLKDAERAWARGGNVGLHHAASGTCVLDIDHEEHAARALAVLDISLDALLSAPGPKIRSAKGLKPVYRVPEGLDLARKALAWTPPGADKPVTVFELRAGKVQDILPPSRHPETGLPYTWEPCMPRRRDEIPELPAQLRVLWEKWPELKPALDRAQPWAPKPSPRVYLEEGGVIGAYNTRHRMQEVLERNGYLAQGDRYLAPSSGTGIPGVSIFKGEDGHERCYSHHGSDPLADGHAHDAFSVYCVLEHRGDVSAAVKAAAAELDLTFTEPSEKKGGGVVAKEDKEPRKSQSTELVELVTASGAELFHNADDEPYISVNVNGHGETYRLRSKGARAWIRRLYHVEKGKSIGGQALQDVLNDLEGMALYDGKCHSVHVRLAEYQGDILLDLGDASHQIVRMTPQGWHVEAHSPVKFVRPKALAPLPLPVLGGSLSELWDLLNVAAEDHVLLAAWLAKALTPTGPYPLLPLHGEQGSAKSTTARAVRALVDPSTAPLRSEPSSAHDLMIAATSSWVPTFDNLSAISKDLSDALCVLSTGGGRATRTLYTDDEETILSAQRPVIMTAISDIATRPDLLDRCIILYLPRITDAKRKSEREFWDAFNRVQGRILGALLTAVSAGLARAPHVQLTELPRMADFAVWAVACEEALGFEPGSFMARYGEVRRDANELALDTSPLPPVLRAFVESHGGRWQGSASELLDALTAHLQTEGDERTLKAREWPKRADKLSGTLRRYAPNLRATGLEVEFERTGKKRSILLYKVEAGGVTGVTGVSGTQGAHDVQHPNDDAKGDAEASTDIGAESAYRKVQRETDDACDGDDAKVATISSWEVEL